MCMIPRIFNKIACQNQAKVMRKHTARMGIFHALSICALITISTSPALGNNYSPTQIETKLLSRKSKVDGSQNKPNSALDKLNIQAQEPLIMSAQYDQTKTMLSRLIALPDLYKNAQLSNPIDLNKEQANLMQQCLRQSENCVLGNHNQPKYHLSNSSIPPPDSRDSPAE